MFGSRSRYHATGLHPEERRRSISSRPSQGPAGPPQAEGTVRGMLDRIAAGPATRGAPYAARAGPLGAPDFRVTPTRSGVSSKLPRLQQGLRVLPRQVMDVRQAPARDAPALETESRRRDARPQHIPVSSAGCYVPGGKYRSSARRIMSVGTARVAGVGHIVACAPPRDSSGMYPHTLYACTPRAPTNIYHLGGVQAFAAMAYGCSACPRSTW